MRSLPACCGCAAFPFCLPLPWGLKGVTTTDCAWFWGRGCCWKGTSLGGCSSAWPCCPKMGWLVSAEGSLCPGCSCPLCKRPRSEEEAAEEVGGGPTVLSSGVMSRFPVQGHRLCDHVEVCAEISFLQCVRIWGNACFWYNFEFMLGHY